MQYLLMCCFDEKKWERIPESERAAIMRDYGTWVQRTTQAGRHLAGAQLHPSSAATTVRVANGKPSITDGPFAETREQFGGYHLMECKDLDEAITLALQIPTLPHGGVVEVRPLLA